MCTTYEEIKMCLTQEKCIREQTNRSISIGILSLIDTVDSKCYLTRIFRPLISANCFTDKEMNPNIKKSMCLQKIKRRNKDGYYGVQNMNDFPEKIGKFVSDITQIKLNSCVVSGGDTLEVTSSIENKNIVLIGNLFYDFVASLLRIYLLILQSMFATHTMEIFNTVVTLESSDQFSVKKFLSEKSTGHSIESVFLKSQLDTNSLTELVLKRIFKFGSPYNLDANHVKAIITDQINAKAYSRLKSKKRLSKDISDDESEMFGTADCGFDYKFKRTSDTDCCTFTTNKISDYNYTMTDESEMLQSLQNFSHNTSSHDFFTECNLTENKSDALDDESWMTIFEINTEIDISPPASSELNENFGGIREDIQSSK